MPTSGRILAWRRWNVKEIRGSEPSRQTELVATDYFKTQRGVVRA